MATFGNDFYTTFNSSLARIILAPSHFFPATAEAVHLNEEGTDGIVRDLLAPPVCCSILNWKERLLLIGLSKTERISRNISFFQSYQMTNVSSQSNHFWKDNL